MTLLLVLLRLASYFQVMNNSEFSSLSAQLLVLQTKHRKLDDDVQELHSFPSLDQLKLQRLKREKIRLKDSIVRIKGQLIPDLDA